MQASELPDFRFLIWNWHKRRNVGLQAASYAEFPLKYCRFPVFAEILSESLLGLVAASLLFVHLTLWKQAHTAL